MSCCFVDVSTAALPPILRSSFWRPASSLGESLACLPRDPCAKLLAILAAFLIFCSFAVPARALDANAYDIAQEAENLLIQGQSTKVERLAAHYRNPHLRVQGGNWQLYHFYGGLSAYKGVGSLGWQSDVEFDTKHLALRSWLEDHPESTAARIALAQFWLRKAWASRGARLSYQATSLQLHAFDEALHQAESYAHGTFGENQQGLVGQGDPHAFLILMELAKSRGHSDKVALIYEHAISRHRLYPHYYPLMAEALLPKWFGDRESLAEFVSGVLDESPGGDAGLQAYSYIAFVLTRNLKPSEIFSNRGLAWGDVKRSFAHRQLQYGLRIRDWNALMYLSIAADDVKTARRALSMIGESWEPLIWISKNAFQKAADWVVTE